jgi:hypothetical protein
MVTFGHLPSSGVSFEPASSTTLTYSIQNHSLFFIP